MADQLAQSPPHSNPAVLDERIRKKAKSVDVTASVVRAAVVQDTDDPMEWSRSWFDVNEDVAKANLLRL